MTQLWNWVRTRPALFAGIAALAINLQGVWLPSFWYDEVFTLHAISRPLDELLALTTTQVDAVHLAYYLFMWVWTSVFGFSELAVRLPSVLAAGIAAFFTSLVAARLFERRTIAFAAGMALAVLPMTVTVSTWARSYALQAAVFAALLWVFIRAMDAQSAGASRRQLGWRWALVAVLLVLLIHLTIYATLLIPVLAVWALIVLRARGWRHLLLPFGLMGLGLVASTPVLLLAISQRRQIAWTGRPSLESVLFEQLFKDQEIVALIGWALIATAMSFALRRECKSAQRQAIAFVVATYAFPTSFVFLLSAERLLGQSLYNWKYFHFVAPAAAILMGLGVHLLFRHTTFRARIAVGLVALLLIAPSLERETKGRDGDWLAGIAAINATEIDRAGFWFANDHTSSMLYVYGDELVGFQDLTRTEQPDSGLITDVIPLPDALGAAVESDLPLFVGYRTVNREKIQAELADLGITEFEEIYADGRFEIVLVG